MPDDSEPGSPETLPRGTRGWATSRVPRPGVWCPTCRSWPADCGRGRTASGLERRPALGPGSALVRAAHERRRHPLRSETREEYKEKLRPLLDLPVELLLPTHGDPVLDDAQRALTRALS